MSMFWRGRLAVVLLLVLSSAGVFAGPVAASSDSTCNTISVGNVTGGDAEIDGGSCTETTTVNVDNSVDTTYVDPYFGVPWYSSYRPWDGLCDWYDYYWNYLYTGYC